MPFQKQPPFEFSNCPEHGDHELASWRTSVDALTTHAEHDQADTTAIKVFDDPQKVGSASRQPVRLTHHQRIATTDEPQSLFEPVTLSDG